MPGESGACKTVKAIFWTWLSDKSLSNLSSLSLVARKRNVKRINEGQRLRAYRRLSLRASAGFAGREGGVVHQVRGWRMRRDGTRGVVQQVARRVGLGSGFRVQGSGFRVQGPGFRVQDSGFRVQGSGFRVQGSGFRVQGSGFRVQGAGFRVQGSGFRPCAIGTPSARRSGGSAGPCRATLPSRGGFGTWFGVQQFMGPSDLLKPVRLERAVAWLQLFPLEKIRQYLLRMLSSLIFLSKYRSR
jgi:hypothetical protein